MSQNDTFNTHIHDHILPSLGTGTSMKGGGKKQALKSFPHYPHDFGND